MSKEEPIIPKSDTINTQIKCSGNRITPAKTRGVLGNNTKPLSRWIKK